MEQKSTAQKWLIAVIAIIVISPIVYWATGIGQHADKLSAAVVAANGTLHNSPKAEALHALVLPIRIEKLIVYPALLFLLQFSGWAVRWRSRIEQWVFRITRRKNRWTRTLAAALFIAWVTATITIIYLPFSIYGFVLRRQFGLSNQPFGAWARDFGVGWLLGLLTNWVLYGGLFALINLSPRRWPVWAGAAFMAFSFGYILLEPVVITPLFYEITPLTDAALRRRIDTMAARAGITIDDVRVINASSKTSAVNAYFTGFGKASKIVLWDTLLKNHPPDEVDMVIAHEMGHWVHRHVLWYVLGGSSALWLGLFALRRWLNRVWRRLGWRSPGDVAAYPYLLGVIALVSALTLPVANGISRAAENQADDFALEIGGKPQAAAQMFERFAVENVSMVTVPAWEKIIFYTHPPLGERIRKAEKKMGK